MEEVRVGNIYRHYKGEKVGVISVKNGQVTYKDLETNEERTKTYVEFIGLSCTGRKRFEFLWHEEI